MKSISRRTLLRVSSASIAGIHLSIAAGVAQAWDPDTWPLLYQSDWSSGSDGWGTPRGWSILRGQLVCASDADTNPLRAPYRPGDDGIADYAIDAEMQIQRWGTGGGTEQSGRFGLAIRGKYFITFERYDFFGRNQVEIFYVDDRQQEILARANYKVGQNWHTFRVEAAGGDIRLLVDGAMLLELTDYRELNGSWTGLLNGVPYLAPCQLAVRSFRITAL